MAAYLRNLSAGAAGSAPDCLSGSSSQPASRHAPTTVDFCAISTRFQWNSAVEGAVLYLGASFAEGYAAGAGARANAYQPPQTIHCFSKRIGSSTYSKFNKIWPINIQDAKIQRTIGVCSTPSCDRGLPSYYVRNQNGYRRRGLPVPPTPRLEARPFNTVRHTTL